MHIDIILAPPIIGESTVKMAHKDFSQGRDMRIKWTRVCRKCLENIPWNKSLLSAICWKEDSHYDIDKVRVWWRVGSNLGNHMEIYDDSMPGRIPHVRPMPLTQFEGKFSLCDRSRCWGDRCKFAHSIEEREAWNGKKFQSKQQRSHSQQPRLKH